MTKFGKLLVLVLLIGIGVFSYFSFFTEDKVLEEELPPTVKIGSATLKGSIQDVFYRFGEEHNVKFQEIAQKFQTASKQQVPLATGLNYFHLDEASFAILGANAQDGLPLNQLLNCVSAEADKLLFLHYKGGKWNGYKGPLGAEVTSIADLTTYKIRAGEGFAIYSTRPSSAYCFKRPQDKAGSRVSSLSPGWNLVAADDQNLATFRSRYSGISRVWYMEDPSRPQPFTITTDGASLNLSHYLLWIKVAADVPQAGAAVAGDGAVAVGANVPTKESLRDAYVNAYCAAQSVGLVEDNGDLKEQAFGVFKRVFLATGLNLDGVDSFEKLMVAVDPFFESEADMYTQDVIDGLSQCSPGFAASLQKEGVQANGGATPDKAEPVGGGSYSIVLVDNGPNGVQIVKILRVMLDTGLKEAKGVFDQAELNPVVLKEGLSAEQAQQWKTDLEAAGATVQVNDAGEKVDGGEPVVGEPVVGDKVIGEPLNIEKMGVVFVDAVCMAKNRFNFENDKIDIDNPGFFAIVKKGLEDAGIMMETVGALQSAIDKLGGYDALFTKFVKAEIENCAPGFFGDGEAVVGGASVILVENGGKKLQVIKALRELLRLDLKSAKDLSDQADGDGEVVLKEGLSAEEAQKWKVDLEAVGAIVKVINNGKVVEAVPPSNNALIGIPTKPEKPIVSNIGHDSVKISWQKPLYEGAQDIIKYSVIVHAGSECAKPEPYGYAYPIFKTLTVGELNGDLSHTIKELMPETDYKVFISATNGINHPDSVDDEYWVSSDCASFTTVVAPEEAPVAALIEVVDPQIKDISMYSLSGPDYINLEWVSNDLVFNGISVKRDQGQFGNATIISPWPDQVCNIGESNVHNYTAVCRARVSSAGKGGIYTFMIKMKNEVDASIYSKDFKMEKPQKIDSSDIEIIHVSSSGKEITLVLNVNNPGGAIKDNFMVYEGVEKIIQSFEAEFEVGANAVKSPKLTIKNLKAGTNYTFYVARYKDNVVGELSDPIKVAPLIGSPVHPGLQ